MPDPICLSSRDLYTVAWICALPLELAAAKAMLDVLHERPRGFTQPRGDTNSYSFGSIGAFNVVIASLPAGEYGVASAANVATNLLSTFPKVQFGLMVGIGAGVPRPGKDIRLGDIVVSQPHGTSGGVVQYDFVKAIQGGGLKHTGSLNSPPRALLSAVSSIQASHAMQPSHIPRYLQEMITRYPTMAQLQQGMPGYIYQGSTNDRLFEPTYAHVAGDDCFECDQSRQEWRATRLTNDPQIHYGVIASGNTLVKNATARESLVQQTGEGCICFEMEAAGLMDHFPCLVIRGICDYADSHKNDRWQRYAAAVAAAYARELLEYVPVYTPDRDAIVNGIWMVSTGSISFTNSGGFLAINGEVPRNKDRKACPWDQCVYDTMGPRSASFLPPLFAHLPIIGLYGGGMITVWDGFDQDYITNFKNLSDRGKNSTHWVEAMMAPAYIVRDSEGRPTFKSTGIGYKVQM